MNKEQTIFGTFMVEQFNFGMSESDSFENQIKTLTTDSMYLIHPKSPVEPWTPSSASETDTLRKKFD